MKKRRIRKSTGVTFHRKDDEILAVANELEIETVLSWDAAKDAARLAVKTLLERGWMRP